LPAASKTEPENLWFQVSGLACSAILSLSISFGGDEFPCLAAGRLRDTIAFVLRRLLARRADAVSAFADGLLLFSNGPPSRTRIEVRTPFPPSMRLLLRERLLFALKKPGRHRSREPLYSATARWTQSTEYLLYCA